MIHGERASDFAPFAFVGTLRASFVKVENRISETTPNISVPGDVIIYGRAYRALEACINVFIIITARARHAHDRTVGGCRLVLRCRRRFEWQWHEISANPLGQAAASVRVRVVDLGVDTLLFVASPLRRRTRSDAARRGFLA